MGQTVPDAATSLITSCEDNNDQTAMTEIGNTLNVVGKMLSLVYWYTSLMVLVWHSGCTLVSINKVNLHWAWLVLGWVTVSGFNSWYGTFISVCNQPPRSTQPGHHSWVGTMSTSQREATP